MLNFLLLLWDFIIHLDAHLQTLIGTYGIWIYGLLFLIIFLETGTVLMPFLPGDSLLFAAGAFAATGALNVGILLVLLIAGAILGDSLNYGVGYHIGKRLCERYPKLIRKEYMDKTKKFYDKYGGKTIVLARFIPIVRTFAPFTAGLGSMEYRKFLTYNIFGAVIWVSLFVLGGFFFGNLKIVQDNFTIVIFIIMGASIIPITYEYIKHKREEQKAESKTE